jgi:hypothetical protein
MEKRLTGVRIALSIDGQDLKADCSLFLESFGPPARWHGRLWNLSTAAHLKKGAKFTLTLPQGATGEATIQRAGLRGGYDFQGEGLPPSF